jgi:hypothetical protein
LHVVGRLFLDGGEPPILPVMRCQPSYPGFRISAI